MTYNNPIYKAPKAALASEALALIKSLTEEVRLKPRFYTQSARKKLQAVLLFLLFLFFTTHVCSLWRINVFTADKVLFLLAHVCLSAELRQKRVQLCYRHQTCRMDRKWL